MIDLSEWISVNDQMPVIPEGKHAISVLCSVHDPVYEECSPGKGSDVQTLSWDGKSFKTIAYGGNGDWGFHQVFDIVTHWMYKPKAFQITDDGFKFDPKGYIGYLPVDYEPVQEAIDARNMTNWFNAYQDVDVFLKSMLKDHFPTEGDTPQHNTIQAIKLLIERDS
jgi:hypothetical protein